MDACEEIIYGVTFPHRLSKIKQTKSKSNKAKTGKQESENWITPNKSVNEIQDSTELLTRHRNNVNENMPHYNNNNDVMRIAKHFHRLMIKLTLFEGEFTIMPGILLQNLLERFNYLLLKILYL